MAVAILGTHAHADVPRAPILWALEEGQTRIRLQWNSRGDEVIDHKIEVCAELDAGDCDETDWTVLVADHPQEPSSTRGNMYKHEDLPAGSTRHYRVSSRNDDGFGAPSTVRSATTNSMVLVPECAAAFWSAEVTVARGLVFDKRGYMSSSFGSISDSGFSRRAATYTVTQLYFNQTSRFAEENYGWTPDYHFAITTALPRSRLGDFVLYVGEVTLPFGSVSAHSMQTYGEGYRWGSSAYKDTFDYVAGDKVTVCLTDAAPIVTLVLTPDSISESGASNSSTVTATVEQASADPFTVTVSAEPISPAGTGDLTLSENKVLTFPANATVSTGAVTITAVNNDVDAPDKKVTVKGELSSGARPTAPDDVELTITDDDDPPVMELVDDTVTEGTAAEFEVRLGAASGREVTVTYATSDDTAEQPGDYASASGTLTFGAGDRVKTITVTTEDDELDEADEETFKVKLSSANNAALSGGGSTLEATGTITDNESVPELELSDVTVTEGTAAEFEVRLGAASEREVTVAYATSDDTAEEPDDYGAESGTLTFGAGDRVKTITVTTEDDALDEADEETFKVKLSSANNAALSGAGSTLEATGTIEDNDSVPELELSDVTVTEGTDAEFEVRLGAASGREVTVAYATSDDTAEELGDYASASGTLTFGAGVVFTRSPAPNVSVPLADA